MRVLGIINDSVASPFNGRNDGRFNVEMIPIRRIADFNIDGPVTGPIRIKKMVSLICVRTSNSFLAMDVSMAAQALNTAQAPIPHNTLANDRRRISDYSLLGCGDEVGAKVPASIRLIDWVKVENPADNA
ncbi:MAG: hypothetical protein R3B95_07725 [Nitrospirales bacterium]|nr:hypothetical protein [Nitrospirales bacterium]